MKIKRHDTVTILTGKDKGKTGKVLKVLPAVDGLSSTRAVVEGLNLRYKHVRPKRSGEKGQRVMFPFAMDISNLAIICSHCAKATRVGYKFFEKVPETSRGKKQRVCKKCGNVI